MFGLEGKVGIVTGGGQGIGRGIANLLGKNGAKVVVADINLETAKRISDEIESSGGKALAHRTNVCDREEVSSLIQNALDNFGQLDIFINNAGIMEVAPIVELTEKQWDSVIDVNLKGVFLCCQAAARVMIKQNHGKIINIASSAGHHGIPGDGAYCASKAGVILLTKVLAIELAKFNINVNAVSPGLIETPMVQRAGEQRPELFEARIRKIPAGRIGQARDIANTVGYLVSPEADYITGQVILVDGGMDAVYAGFA